MDVVLYIYDLSQGLARSMSAALLGIQIDAVYHTSIVMEGIEYVYDGGVNTIKPGSSHLGRPMETLPLGKTSLPMDVIMDYLESLREIYTAEAYDLWRHNCNNFSNDFAMFLTGQGIPSHIANLPETVLNTPFGRMMQPTINESIRARKEQTGAALGLANSSTLREAPKSSHQHAASVKIVSKGQELESLLNSARASCAAIFFTSSSCGPCKPLYPVYQELAAETAGKAVLIRIDISLVPDVAMRYSVSATPTFVTYLHGTEESRWSGADAVRLRGNIRSLVMTAWPPHPHESLRLPAFRNAAVKPVIYSKMPPLDKLLAKLGRVAGDPAIRSLHTFIATERTEGAAEASLPDMHVITQFYGTQLSQIQRGDLFAPVDLLRIAMADPRFSGYLAEERDHHTIVSLLGRIGTECPYSLRLVALQLVCNMFSSPLYPVHILTSERLRTPIIALLTTSLLDETHPNVRVAASSLAFNVAQANAATRIEEHHEALPVSEQIELAASLLEAISNEETSPDAFKGLLLALGHLVYRAQSDGELLDLVKAMDAAGTIVGKSTNFPDEPLVEELGKKLLA